MKRAEWLRETKMRRFEEALSGWTESRLTQEAAALLSVCPRSFRRYVERCHEEGLEGLRTSGCRRRRRGGRRWTRRCGWRRCTGSGTRVDGGALPRALPGEAQRVAVVNVDEEPAAGGGAVAKGRRQGKRRSSRQSPKQEQWTSEVTGKWVTHGERPVLERRRSAASNSATRAWAAERAAASRLARAASRSAWIDSRSTAL